MSKINLFLNLNSYSGEDSEARKVIFEYFGDDIDFEVEIEAEDDDSYFVIARVNNPLGLLQMNAFLWFRDISDAELDNATIENGTILINKEVNKEMYSHIINRIQASSEIEIDLR